MKVRIGVVAVGLSVALVGCSTGGYPRARPSTSPVPTASRVVAPKAARVRVVPRVPRLPVLPTKDQGGIFAFPASCNLDGTQMELDACALDGMYAANERLNAAVLARWKVADSIERGLLATAEARWLVAARAYCDWAVDVNRGGSIVGMNWPACMADQARSQARLIASRDGLDQP